MNGLPTIGNNSFSYELVNRKNCWNRNRESYNVETMETLQDRLLRARTIRELSQEEVAKRAGITQPTYSDLESGKSKSSTKLAKIATALGVNLVWLMTGEGDMDSPAGFNADPKAEYTNPYVSLILAECTKAPPELLPVVLGILNGTIAAPGKSPIDENPFVRMQYERFGALSEDVESYYAASSDKKRKEIQLEIGGRVINMFDQRQRQGKPPDGVEERRDGSKS